MHVTGGPDGARSAGGGLLQSRRGACNRRRPSRWPHPWSQRRPAPLVLTKHPLRGCHASRQRWHWCLLSCAVPSGPVLRASWCALHTDQHTRCASSSDQRTRCASNRSSGIVPCHAPWKVSAFRFCGLSLAQFFCPTYAIWVMMEKWYRLFRGLLFS